MWGQNELMYISGGLFPNGNHMPDWVDSTVAGWTQSETDGGYRLGTARAAKCTRLCAHTSVGVFL